MRKNYKKKNDKTNFNWESNWRSKGGGIRNGKRKIIGKTVEDIKYEEGDIRIIFTDGTVLRLSAVLIEDIENID